MNRIAAAVFGFAALVAANSALAQSTFTTQQPNVNAPGVVNMCRGQDGNTRPCDGLQPLPVQIAGGIAALSYPYPIGSFPITGNAAGTTGAVVGTLAAATGKTTYICGFDVSALGGTATVGPITIAGLTGSSMVYQFSSTAAGATLNRTFTPCIPAATIATAITITTTADGSATAVDVNSWGFQL